MFIKLFFLVIAHAVTDFGFQTEFMANMKNREFYIKSKHMASERNKYFPLWIYMLGVHSVINGGAVYFITESIQLAIIEILFHFLIDFVKGEGLIDFKTDQFLHFLTKLTYIIKV